MNKKLLALALAGTFAFAGCGNNAEEKPAETTTEPAVEEPATDAEETTEDAAEEATDAEETTDEAAEETTEDAEAEDSDNN